MRRQVAKVLFKPFSSRPVWVTLCKWFSIRWRVPSVFVNLIMENGIQEKWHQLHVVYWETWDYIQYSLNFLPISPFYCLFPNKSAFDFQPTSNFNSGYFSLFYMTTNASEPWGCQGRAQKYRSHEGPLFHGNSHNKLFVHFPILLYSLVLPLSLSSQWTAT